MLAESYCDKSIELLREVQKTQGERIIEAAGLISRAIAAGNTLHVFGCGHSALLAQEVFYRGSGLIVVNPIFAPGTLLTDHPVTISSQVERMEGYAKILLDTAPVRAGDIIIVISTGGRNPVSIEMAIEAKKRGLKVIVITSTLSRDVPSRHSSGKKLQDLGDVVIDNRTVTGDAILTVEGLPMRIGPTSTLAGTLILQAMVCQVIENLLEAGVEPPIAMNGNLEGADAHNAEVFRKYRDRILYLSRT